MISDNIFRKIMLVVLINNIMKKIIPLFSIVERDTRKSVLEQKT